MLFKEECHCKMKLFLDFGFKGSLKTCSKFSFTAPLEAKATLSEGENNFSISTPSQVTLCEAFSYCHRWVSAGQLQLIRKSGAETLAIIKAIQPPLCIRKNRKQSDKSRSEEAQ